MSRSAPIFPMPCSSGPHWMWFQQGISHPVGTVNSGWFSWVPILWHQGMRACCPSRWRTLPTIPRQWLKWLFPSVHQYSRCPTMLCYNLGDCNHSSPWAGPALSACWMTLPPLESSSPGWAGYWAGPRHWVSPDDRVTLAGGTYVIANANTAFTILVSVLSSLVLRSPGDGQIEHGVAVARGMAANHANSSCTDWFSITLMTCISTALGSSSSHLHFVDCLLFLTMIGLAPTPPELTIPAGTWQSQFAALLVSALVAYGEGCLAAGGSIVNVPMWAETARVNQAVLHHPAVEMLIDDGASLLDELLVGLAPHHGHLLLGTSQHLTHWLLLTCYIIV